MSEFSCGLCGIPCSEEQGSWDGPEHTPEGFLCYECLGQLEDLVFDEDGRFIGYVSELDDEEPQAY